LKSFFFPVREVTVLLSAMPVLKMLKVWKDIKVAPTPKHHDTNIWGWGGMEVKLHEFFV
jgi:hypothetical protein